MKHPSIDFSSTEYALIMTLHAVATRDIGRRISAEGRPLPAPHVRAALSRKLQDATAEVVFDLRGRNDVPSNLEVLQWIDGLVQGAIDRFIETPPREPKALH